jgi:hypothetical protein
MRDEKIEEDEFIKVITDSIIKDERNEVLREYFKGISKKVLLERYCKQRISLFEELKVAIKFHFGESEVESITIKIISDIFDFYNKGE